jgi:hypothetical protein
MYSVALDSTVAYTNTNQPPFVHVLYIYNNFFLRGDFCGKDIYLVEFVCGC